MTQTDKQLSLPTASGPDTAALPGVPPERMPRHIAIIMDGNGRWARRRGLPRFEGHRRGADSVRRIVEECCRLGIDQLTLYCLSSENWKRPKVELDFLMELLRWYAIQERPEILRQNIRFTTIGLRSGIPDRVWAEVEETKRQSAANTGMILCLAINYGGRLEITEAVRRIVQEAVAGRIRPDEIDERTISEHLFTAGMPDPDLLIRTAGEYRVSNFLLWQISYTEFWVTDVLWPDFREQHLHEAIRDFARRERRFGGILG